MPNSRHSSVMPNSSAVPSSRWEATKACASATVVSVATGLNDTLQAHGDAHIATDLELAGHEAGGRFQVAVQQGLQVLQRDAHGAIGIGVVVAHAVGGAHAVDDDHAVGAHVELQGGVEAAVGAHFGADGFGCGGEGHGGFLVSWREVRAGWYPRSIT